MQTHVLVSPIRARRLHFNRKSLPVECADYMLHRVQRSHIARSDCESVAGESKACLSS